MKQLNLRYVQRFKKQEKNKRFKVIKNFANQILKGLAYLHGRQPPVIHRDLKCDNVFVTGQCGQVKIGDLGLATLKKSSFAKSVIGTPEFMAPEMYSEQYDESIDVYAFGMCLLEMATGEYPYQECTKPFEIYKRVTQGIRPDNYYRIDDDDLKELIDLCIRQKKTQRPTVKDLVNHSWFMENNGLKLDVHRDEKTKKIFYSPESQVLFRLKLIDKTKHKNWPDNEAIEFIFDVDKDNPETIVKELKDNIGKINDEDLRYLIQAIKDKCSVFKLEREDRLEEEQNQVNTTTTTAAPTATPNPTVNTTNIPSSNVTMVAQTQPVSNVPVTQTQVVISEQVLNKTMTSSSVPQQQQQQNISKPMPDITSSSPLLQQQQQQIIDKQNQQQQQQQQIKNKDNLIEVVDISVQQQQQFVNPQQQQQQPQQLANFEQQYYQQALIQTQQHLVHDEVNSSSSSPLTVIDNNVDLLKPIIKQKVFKV